MHPTDRPSKGRGLLPEEALSCVWMDAGLVAYKLCDRHYECEHCPFDASLHGRPAVQAHEAGRNVTTVIVRGPRPGEQDPGEAPVQVLEVHLR